MSDDVARAVPPGEGYDFEEEAANQVERVGEEDGRVEEEARPTEFLGRRAASTMVMLVVMVMVMAMVMVMVMVMVATEYAPKHGVVEDVRVQDAHDQGQQD
jgi:preprotein translocase subunit SecF